MSKFKLRSVELKDIDDLFELSKLYTFINLPSNIDIISDKVSSSLKSFTEPSDDLSENHYIFVLEDLETNKVIGCSMIHAQHGTEDEPHFYLKVSQENKFSATINTGFIHGTLKLGHDTNGPTEIGGLILNPNYRGSDQKLGKQLSFIRFLYMGLNQKRFKPVVHSELMPPFDAEGRSPLWEAIGRRFLNMEYQDADILSRKNKEFILSLFPKGTIYETLLPIEARNAVGKVGKDTQPVKKMLESVGFKYINEVDPFDGGPHFRAKLKNITIVKGISKTKIKFSTADKGETSLLVSPLKQKKNIFEAFYCKGQITKDALMINKEYKYILNELEDENVHYTKL